MTEQVEVHGKVTVQPDQLIRRALWIMLLLAFLLVCALIFDIWLWNDSRKTSAELRASEQARATERVFQCYNSIAFVKTANTIVLQHQNDTKIRIQQAKKLAAADPTQALRKAHLEIAAQQEQQLKELKFFPNVTRASCDKLASKLGVPPAEAG